MSDDLDKIVEEQASELDEVSPQELEVVLRLVASKLPPVIAALEQGGNGWKQCMSLACYLLATVLNRHPEYTGNAFALLSALGDHYPHVEAGFAADNPGLMSELIKQDIAFFLLPDTNAIQGK